MTYRTALKSTALAAVLGTVSAFSAQAVFFHTGSGSIDGSLCVGNDCVSSEAFGFDTIRLKENNLRIHFDDTSTAASFPPNDWRLYANDSANGGSSYFGIEDATAGRFVFRVFAGARSNAMVIDSQGDLGLGTTTPAVDIDIKTGNTPTVRLQQDGTSGFTPQTWDMAGNEAGFFIRDVTGGSQLPFRIIPGADSNALVIDDDNDIGIGAGTNPDEHLHVAGSGTQIILLESTDDGATQFRMKSGVDNNRRILAVDGSDTVEVQMSFDNNKIRFLGATGADLWATLDASGIETTGGGACDGTPCDAVFDPAVYTVPSIEEHAALMWENKHLPAVGPTEPDKPVNLTQKTLRILNELEHAHIYIEQLNSRIAVLEEKLQVAAD